MGAAGVGARDGHCDPFVVDAVVPAGDEAHACCWVVGAVILVMTVVVITVVAVVIVGLGGGCAGCFPPELDFCGPFVRLDAAESRGRFGGYPVCSAGEDEVVAKCEGVHEGLGDVEVVEVEGEVADFLFAVGELRELVGSWSVEFVDVRGDIVRVIHQGKSDAEVGVVVLVVGVTVHVVELGVFERMACMGYHQGFVIFRRWLSVRYIVHVTGVRASVPFEGWWEAKLQNCVLEISGVGLGAKL